MYMFNRRGDDWLHMELKMSNVNKLKIIKVEMPTRGGSRMEKIRKSKYPFLEITRIGEGFDFPLTEQKTVCEYAYYLNEQAKKKKIPKVVFTVFKISKTHGKVRRNV